MYLVSKRAKLRWNRLKSKSRWPTKRFRAIGRSLSLSADPLIDLFDLTAGEGYETTAGFTVERPYRLFIAADPEIPIDIGIENGTKASFWWLVTTPTRIVAAIKFMAESNCRVDFASKVIDQSVSSRFHSLLSIFFFFDQIRLNWTTFLFLFFFFLET